ncbi:MAG: hypothetical protein IPM91_17460 [Bacteroidetes bacterium]|nr:hypothetical protein [Bacteroidota bacterium]
MKSEQVKMQRKLLNVINKDASILNSCFDWTKALIKIEQTQLKINGGIRKLYLLVLAAALKVMQPLYLRMEEKASP